MNIVLWILQVLLAALFLWHGHLLLFPPAELVEIINREFDLWFRTFLGIAEVLAAVGLMVPGMIRVLPWMIPATAVCLMILKARTGVVSASRSTKLESIGAWNF